MKRFLRWWFDDFGVGFYAGSAFVGLGITWMALATSFGVVVAGVVIQVLAKE